MYSMETGLVTIDKSEYEMLLKLGKTVPVLISDNAQLKADNAQLKDDNAQLKSDNAQLQTENKLLRDKVDILARRVFGSSSEKIDSDQLLLDLGDDFEQALNEEQDDDSNEPEPPPKSRKKRTLKKDRLPDDLPEERITIIPEEVKANPDDYDQISVEETVKLDVTPMQFKKVITVRPKFIKKDRSSAPVIAPAPNQLIAGSFASPSLIARILTGKFVDHLPFYRQEQIFLRHGIILSRKTMSNWAMRMGGWFRIIDDEIRRELLQAKYLQIDETPVFYLDPGSGKTRKGYLWVFHAPGMGVYIQWYPSRKASCLQDMLNEYDGTIQNDGYSGYWCYNNYRVTDLKKTLLEITCCWAHARRKFFEAKAESKLAKKMLLEIKELYGIETSLRESQSSKTEREKVRREQSQPILDRIKQRLEQESGKHLPKSLTGKAIRYTLNLWKELNGFVNNGEVEIDNNLVENLIRVPALGKKNWLFFGSKDAGEENAIIMTVLLNCKILGINPEEYLTDVLSRLPHITNHQARELTPAKWLAARQSQSMTG
jgi:transposase